MKPDSSEPVYNNRHLSDIAALSAAMEVHNRRTTSKQLWESAYITFQRESSRLQTVRPHMGKRMRLWTALRQPRIIHQCRHGVVLTTTSSIVRSTKSMTSKRIHMSAFPSHRASTNTTTIRRPPLKTTRHRSLSWPGWPTDTRLLHPVQALVVHIPNQAQPYNNPFSLAQKPLCVIYSPH